MKELTEIFKKVPNTDGAYEVSNFGTVRSVDRVIAHSNRGVVSTRTYKGSIISQRVKKNGYMEVGVSVKGKHVFYLVHRLVATAFIDNCDLTLQVNHIDGDKTNNHVSNLEWVTSKENHRHATALGLGHYTDGRNGFAKSVKNTISGVVHETAKMAYYEYCPGYGYTNFTRKISGVYKNTTPYQYITSKQ